MAYLGTPTDTAERVFDSNVSIPKFFLSSTPEIQRPVRIKVGEKFIKCQHYCTPHFDFFCCSTKITAYGTTYCHVLRISGQSKLV